jgi:hypothetical protein
MDTDKSNYFRDLVMTCVSAVGGGFLSIVLVLNVTMIELPNGLKVRRKSLVIKTKSLFKMFSLLLSSVVNYFFTVSRMRAATASPTDWVVPVPFRRSGVVGPTTMR